MNRPQHSDRPAEPNRSRSATDESTYGAFPHIVGVAAGYPPGFYRDGFANDLIDLRRGAPGTAARMGGNTRERSDGRWTQRDGSATSFRSRAVACGLTRAQVPRDSTSTRRGGFRASSSSRRQSPVIARCSTRESCPRWVPLNCEGSTPTSSEHGSLRWQRMDCRRRGWVRRNGSSLRYSPRLSTTGLIGRTPAETVKAPKTRERDQRYLTAEQVTELADAVEQRMPGGAPLVKLLAYGRLVWSPPKSHRSRTTCDIQPRVRRFQPAQA